MGMGKCSIRERLSPRESWRGTVTGGGHVRVAENAEAATWGLDPRAGLPRFESWFCHSSFAMAGKVLKPSVPQFLHQFSGE